MDFLKNQINLNGSVPERVKLYYFFRFVLKMLRHVFQMEFEIGKRYIPCSLWEVSQIDDSSAAALVI